MSDEAPELTLSQVIQVGQLIIPQVKDALRSEFHALRNDFNAELLSRDERIKELDARVANLETVRNRLIAVWSLISCGAATAGGAVWTVVKPKLGL